jgi:uncharacterized protein YbbC (DUF1343 family)
MATIVTGLERFIDAAPGWVSGTKIGLLCNSASVDRTFTHARKLIAKRFPGRLHALFSPQHGFFSEKQDNMIESDHAVDPVLNIPIYSLYGETRIPTEEMLEGIDVLLVDLQDVGTRVYTFAATVSYCLEAAKRCRKKVLILDRPNPIDGKTVEGNLLAPDCASFVGRFPIPMRHGLTLGELMSLINSSFGIDCELDVVTMAGWKRTMLYSDTGLPWLPPSPNLPTPASAMVYPGQVIWEGTNVSEGRGTTQPFEVFGAPYIETDAVIRNLKTEDTEGVILRPVAFEPTSNKWSSVCCRGFQIHVTAPRRYSPYSLTLRLLRTIYNLYSGQFQWKKPPYEYEYERLPIDLILGDRRIREGIECDVPVEQIESLWQAPLAEYKALSRGFHRYPE